MEVFLIKAAQLILSLSILVVLHELGHFIPAKLFKTRVEKFYLFFDPWFSVFKKKIGDTEYGIGWLPLGGYVKISGMVDESMDKEQMEKPAEPWEFRSKPAWQRLIIMLGGVTVNLILGILIYIMVLFVWGKEYIPIQNATYGLHCDSLMIANGFAEGDKIVRVGNEVPLTIGEVSKKIIIAGVKQVTVLRNGIETTITLPSNIEDQILNSGSKQLFEYRIPTIVDSIVTGENAQKAGLIKGDKIILVNEDTTLYYKDFRKKLETVKNKQVILGVERNGSFVQLNALVKENATIGFWSLGEDKLLKVKTEKFSFFESIPAGYEHAKTTLSGYVQSLKLLFTASGAKQVGGFGSIGGLFAPQWHWQSFWEMTAFISIILAFMNILPIPALDGGHVLFLLWEMITGRQANQKFMEYAQIAGMVLLLGLTLYGNGNDIFRAFGK
jgi:regulator of sigma E protease